MDSFRHHNKQSTFVLQVIDFDRKDGSEHILLIVLAEEKIKGVDDNNSFLRNIFCPIR